VISERQRGRFSLVFNHTLVLEKLQFIFDRDRDREKGKDEGGRMKDKKMKRKFFALVLSVFLLISLDGNAQEKGFKRVRVALGSISVNASVIPIGKEAGIFGKHGLEVEPIYMGGGMNSLAAVTSGSVDFLFAGSTANISARLGGVDITMLAVQSNRIDYTVFSSPEVKSPQDLKGKIVTGTRPGASADSALRLALHKWGLEPDKDVVFISVAESQQGRLNALTRGSVSATVLTPPFSGIAKQMGMRELADLRTLDVEYPGTSIAAMGAYIKSHPATVESFLKGYVETLHFMRTQKEKSISAVMKFLKMSDRARAEEGYSYYVEIWPAVPLASTAATKNALQFLAHRQPKAVNANPEEFYDMSFLKKIEESGFVRSLYGRK
jgi:NitT/TauT family transport system substrate-binding protein